MPQPMNMVEQARMLLARLGELRPQSASDWDGDFPLPPDVEAFYREVGPMDVIVEGYGNPYFLPRLARLWDFQRGYRLHGLTGERIEGWNDEWLVVADQGGDAFIFDGASGKVLCARHGEGAWNPEEWFTDLPTMAACLATLGSVARTAGDDLTDADCLIRPEHRERAVSMIAEILGDRTDAEVVVDGAGWG